ncbi:MAG: hypothetical protein ACREHD_09095 [Pirellulales bacterium]
MQATMTTAHVATGSLILELAVVLALRAWRYEASGVRRQASGNENGQPTALRGESAAHFAFCVLRFAFCISRLAAEFQCKMQNAKCKMQNRINHASLSAEDVA